MSPEPSLAHPKDTVRVLLESAIHCFASKGFDSTSIREIAKHAGKPVSLIGYHFGNKENLYLRCFQYLFELFPGTPLDPVHADSLAIGKDPHLAAQALRRIVQVMMQDIFSGDGDPLKEAFISLFVREMRSPRPLLQAMYLEESAEKVRVLRACIASLRPDLLAGEISFIGQSLCGQCMINCLASGWNALVWQPLPASESPVVLANRIADFALRGLGYSGEP